MVGVALGYIRRWLSCVTSSLFLACSFVAQDPDVATAGS